MVLAALLVASLAPGVGGGFSAPLEHWEWAADASQTPPAAGPWNATGRPAASVGGFGESTVWFKAVLPRLSGEEAPALLVGRHRGALELFLDNDLLHSFPSSREKPWRVVPLARDSGGKTLYLRVTQKPGYAGQVSIIGGVRFGSSADHYLWMLHHEWQMVALAIALLVAAALMLVAHVASRMLRQAMGFGPVAVMCAATAASFLSTGASHLVPLVLLPYPLMDALNIMAPALLGVAEVFYVRSVFGRVRFGLAWSVALNLALSVVLAVARHFDLFELPRLVQTFAVLDAATSLLLLANVLAAWRRLSRGLRVASIGLVFSETFSLYQLAVLALGVSGPVNGAELGVWATGAYVCFVVLSFFVVTFEQRAAQEREQKDLAQARAIAQTATMFAHDARKPFAVLDSVLGLIGEASTMSEVGHALKVVASDLKETRRSIDEMIDGLLDAGKGRPMRPANEELEEMLFALWRQIGLTTELGRVTFRRELKHTRQVTVERSRISRAFANIIYNALEAMRCSGELCFSSTDCDVEGRRMIALTIGNSGSFIPAGRVKRIFEPFVTEGKTQGTGLGLWIAKNAVESHGGTIRCESSEATGVEFTLTLPAAPQERTALIDWTAATPSWPPTLLGASAGTSEDDRGPREAEYLILVDDSAGIRLAWRNRLPAGALVEFASPAEFLAAADEQASLLRDARYVVLDHHFGRGQIDGLALGELLQRRTAAPILLCSAVAFDSLPAWCSAQLAKTTYDFEELSRVVVNR